MKRSTLAVLVGAGTATLSVMLLVGACSTVDHAMTGGKCSAMVDDGNPCTIDVCEGNDVRRENAPSDTTCKVGDTAGSCIQGQCQITCVEGNCPQLNACRTSECSNGKCVVTNVPMGAIPGANDPTDGDCKIPGCDGFGEEVNVSDDQDEPEAEECVTSKCESGTLKKSNVEEGKACKKSIGKVCDKKQMCVTCLYNKLKDDNESDVDCGGMSTCNKCENGKICAASTDCLTNQCVDNVCCHSSCEDDCESCNLPGLKGECAQIPPGTYDPDHMMCLCITNMNACGDKGKEPNGGPCTNDEHCASGQCVCPLGGCAMNKGTCKQPLNSSCEDGMVCASGECIDNKCRLQDGVFCSMPEECAGACSNSLCVPCNPGAVCPIGKMCINGDCVKSQ